MQGLKINQSLIPLKTDIVFFLDICWQPVAHQIQCSIINRKEESQVVDRSEILLPGVSFLRGREDREEHSGQKTLSRMLSMYKSLPSAFQNLLLRVNNSHPCDIRGA